MWELDSKIRESFIVFKLVNNQNVICSVSYTASSDDERINGHRTTLKIIEAVLDSVYKGRLICENACTFTINKTNLKEDNLAFESFEQYSNSFMDSRNFLFTKDKILSFYIPDDFLVFQWAAFLRLKEQEYRNAIAEKKILIRGKDYTWKKTSTHIFIGQVMFDLITGHLDDKLDKSEAGRIWTAVHDSGWSISGTLVWQGELSVLDFSAVYNKGKQKGYIYGDFREQVTVSSISAFKNFCSTHLAGDIVFL